MRLLQQESACDPAAPAPCTGNGTILIVDDTSHSLAMVAGFLKRHGFQVAVAEDGEEAVERAMLVLPELILLDVMLPGADGFAVCRRLKADARVRDIPVIFMTALDDPAMVEQGFEAGAVDYVTKPLRLDEMMRRIDTHLKLHALQKQLEAQNAQLREAGERLEQQVAQRTAELSRANVRLQDEISERKRMAMQLQEKDRLYRDIFENTSDGVAFFEVTPDLRFRIISINPAFEKLARKTCSEVEGKYIEEYFPAEAAARLTAVYRRCVELGVALDYDTKHEWPAGLRMDRATAIPVRNEAGRIHRIAVISRDVTQRRLLEQLLRKREAEMRALVEKSPDGIVRYDADLRIVYRNPIMAKLTGKASEEVLGKRVDELYPNEPLILQLKAMLEQVIATGEPAEFEMIGELRQLKHRVYDHVLLVPEFSEDGKVCGVIGIGRDVSRQKQLEEELRRRASEFRELVEHSPDTIARYDRDCRRIYANPRLVAGLGGDPERVLGTTPEEWPGGPAGRAYLDAMRKVLEQGEMCDFELRWESDGRELCSHVRLSPEFDPSGQVTHVLAVGRDITDIDQYRKKIHHQAFFDSLTGLPNRLLLSDRLSGAIAGAGCYGVQFGLMILDLDHFKNVNDTLGHSVGDRLLCETAARLQQCVRPCDMVARLGGDEFAIVVNDMKYGDELVRIADRILLRLAEPFVMEGRELFVTCSIGAALFPCDATDADGLYKYADSAMYHAKKMGRNNFQLYARELTARSVERLDAEVALRKAQRNGELVLYYQPQIDLHEGGLIGAEALLRWNRPGHGLVGPDSFIPLAEESGLIVDIGEWVLKSACQAVVRWNRDRKRAVKVAVNMSSRQFVRNDLVDTVLRTLSETGCKAEWLELEITESLLLEDSEEVTATLAAFHEMGITISIDDFGTGYSALSYLHRFPVGRLKIDRSFVNGITEQRDKRELVKAMLSIASALRIESVAEGVETTTQAEYLMARGCRVAQGYLFGKPMPLDEFESLLTPECAQ